MRTENRKLVRLLLVAGIIAMAILLVLQHRNPPLTYQPLIKAQEGTK